MNKNILITGATSGLGLGLARCYAKKGYSLVLLSRRKDILEELKKEFGEKCLTYPVDVTNRKDVFKAVHSAEEKLGSLDIVIASAGIGGGMSFRNYDFEKAKKLYDVNVFGVLNIFSAALPSMIKNKSGHLVGLSSLASYAGMPNNHAYCGSKAALRVQLDGIREECEPLGVHVSTICPGFVKTPLTQVNTFKMPLLMDLDEACDIMTDGIERKLDTINFPKLSYFYMAIRSLIPRRIRRMFEPVKNIPA